MEAEAAAPPQDDIFSFGGITQKMMDELLTIVLKNQLQKMTAASAWPTSACWSARMNNRHASVARSAVHE